MRRLPLPFLTRALLAFPLLLGPVAASCSPPAAQAPAKQTNAAPTEPVEEQRGERGGVSFRRIAPGVWLHSAYHTMPDAGPVVSNGLLIEDGNHTVLVDTAWNDAQTRSILEWAQETLRKPVTAAVFTHAHADKMGGVAALRQAGVKTFASGLSNADAAKRGLQPAETTLDFDSQGWLTPASLQAAAPLGPVRLFYPGPGHTRDNIVAGVPGAKILFGGCLIRPPGSTSMGNTADGDLSHWGTAAQAAGAAFPDATSVIPSHGPPAGRELLILTVNLADQAKAAM